jgi:hypothetical protein
MKPVETNSRGNKAQLLIAIVLLTMKAFAQDGAGRPQRRVVVSIPDRQLAVIEDGEILRIFDVAVGASVSPSPHWRVPYHEPRHPSDLLPRGPDYSSG